MRVEIIVPSSLNDITLEQYQKFEKINTEDNADSNFLLHKTVEIFCNLELKDIAKIKFSSVMGVIEDINKAFETKNELIPTFNLNGTTYGFITNLDDMTLGEYIDLDENLGDWSSMHKAMRVLYRPIKLQKGDRYQIEEYDGLKSADIMKRMPLDVVMGAMVFFWNLNSELLETTLNYLSRELKEDKNTHLLQHLEKNGVGIKASMESLKEMLPSLTRLQD
jgi:hypothetical protein